MTPETPAPPEAGATTSPDLLASVDLDAMRLRTDPAADAAVAGYFADVEATAPDELFRSLV